VSKNPQQIALLQLTLLVAVMGCFAANVLITIRHNQPAVVSFFGQFNLQVRGKKMKKISIFSIMFLTLLSPVFALADSPEATVTEAIAAVKKTGSPASVLEYVHWESAFKDLSAEQRTAMKVNSPPELKAFYAKALSNPETLVDEQIARLGSSVPPEQKQFLLVQMEQLKTQMRQKMKEQEKKIMDASYQVVGTDIKGDTAVVNVQSTMPGEAPTQHKLNLVNVEGKWLLAGLTNFSKP